MEEIVEKKPSLKKLGRIRRTSISVSQEELVKMEPFSPDQSLPLVIRPVMKGINLLDWIGSNGDRIESSVLKHGGVLLRGFTKLNLEDLEQVIRSNWGEPLEYKERSSPRSQVSGRVYTSTDYPPDQEIFLHNENSYQHAWPMKIFFFCEVAALQGGETPIADCRKILQRIDPEIRQKFLAKRWMAVRNFGDGFGLHWHTVFQTTEKSAVEHYCRERGMEAEWKPGNRLRTRAVRPALVRHPKTGEMTWFNHATFFNISTLSPPVREALLAEFSVEDLPSHSYYGDGSEIEPETLDALRDAYRQETVHFQWQTGDLLILDNLLVAHGRAPFSGPRQVVVGMAQPRTWEDLG